MKYSEFKAQREQEAKALKNVNGFWTMLAYLISYRLKELLLVLIAALSFWIVALIANPHVAASIRHFVTRYFSG